jgi:glycosyltransferase involved in cell wall biosynthesis
MRILQVVGGMNRHGTETWLMNVLRHIDRAKFQMDFLVHTDEQQAYESEAKALGSQVIRCLHPSRPWIYAKNFGQVLREHGSYDVVHSHIHHYSGFVLRLAHQAGISVRIAHSHSDTVQIESKSSLSRKAYCKLMRSWISRYSTTGLSVSKASAPALFGANWQKDSRWKVVHCGIDLAPFKISVDSATVRSELGIAPDAFVIGHVGRFHQPKNHDFLVEIFAELIKHEPKACLLLVGEGKLRLAIEQKVKQLGLTKQVIFTGLRSDVPRLLQGAMDVFLFPSLYEGLGLVLVEAQAAGLPCIFSDTIPEEADVLMPLVHRLPLSKDAQAWAESILAAQKQSLSLNSLASLEELKQSDFNVLDGIRKLEELYARNY